MMFSIISFINTHPSSLPSSTSTEGENHGLFSISNPTATAMNRLVCPSTSFASTSFPVSFEKFLSDQLSRIQSEKETTHKTSLETIKLRLVSRILNHMDMSFEDIYSLQTAVFVHPQCSEKLRRILGRIDSRVLRRLLDRISSSDYNDLEDVKELVEVLVGEENEEAKQLKLSDSVKWQINAVFANDGLGDCVENLKYPLRDHAITRVKVCSWPGSDFDALSVHVKAVRKMYENWSWLRPRDIYNTILDFYNQDWDEEDEEDGQEKKKRRGRSHLEEMYQELVGSFAIQVKEEVIGPRFRAKFQQSNSSQQ